MKSTLVFVVMLVFSLSVVTPVYASYILPYPSFMPGNKLYVISKVLDRIKAYWYWGDIGAFRYHLGLSDKYLVEAKTLFEYRQYLLGVSALERSDREFRQVPGYLVSAGRDGKDITVLKQTFLDASFVHQAVITRLLAETPVSFTWTPEKSAASILELHALIEKSLSVRKAAVLP